MKITIRLVPLFALCFLAAPRVEAASHQWRFHELFSNADGTVQFIEMKECCGFTTEHELGGKWVLVVEADHQYNFRGNLTGNTANRHLLLATQGFADLPGAPAPDHILPDGFLAVEGDVLEYWQYAAATWDYGALPTDGISSLNPDGSTGVNSPTNYAGETGTVDLSVPVAPTTWSRIKAID